MTSTTRFIIATVLVIVGGIWFFSNKATEPQIEGGSQDLSELYSNTSPAPDTIPVIGEVPVSNPNPSVIINTNETKMVATFKTTKGDITIEFFAQEAPNTVANFTKLAESGFYNGTKFHRIIANFMIQGGDPLTKDDAQMARWGTGGPGYKFNDEIHAKNNNDVGTIAMANSGPNTNGSQFFINVNGNNFLDTKHTVFGKVISGMDVVKAIENTKVDGSDRPVEPVVITSVHLGK